MREQAIVLIHKAQLSLTGRYVPYVGSVKEDAAGVTGKHAADGLQEYGLAGACAAQDGKDFPYLDGKRDGRQCKTASFYGKIVDNSGLEDYIKTIPAASLSCSADHDARQAFLAYLNSGDVQEIWLKYGYEIAE